MKSRMSATRTMITMARVTGEVCPVTEGLTPRQTIVIKSSVIKSSPLITRGSAGRGSSPKANPSLDRVLVNLLELVVGEVGVLEAGDVLLQLLDRGSSDQD